MTDPDLLAVRQLAPEPTDESLTRSWYRITQLEAIRSRPARLRRLKPILAAFAVVLLASASVAVLKVGPGTLWPVASTPETIDTLLALADAAEAGEPAPQLKEGQLIRVKSEGWAAGCSPTECQIEPQPREIWHDPQGMRAVKIMSGSEVLLPQPGDAQAKAHTTDGQEIPPPSPGLTAPTPQWLASLPTDTRELLKVLRRETPDNESWSKDHQLWDAMGQLYASCEILLTPKQRATLLRAFTGMSGLSTRPVTIDGRQLVSIRQTDDNSGHEIIFDPASGRAVGRGSFYGGSDLIIHQAPNGPVLEPGIMYEATWTQSIVDGL